MSRRDKRSLALLPNLLGDYVIYQPRRSGPKKGWIPRDYYDYDGYIIETRLRQGEMRRRVLDTAAALLDEVGPRRSEWLQRPGELWLLAAAEGVRSKRRPDLDPSTEAAFPFPAPVVQAVAEALAAAQRAGALPAITDLREAARWLCGLWWLKETITGPRRDAPRERPLNGLATAVAWLLAGAAV